MRRGPSQVIEFKYRAEFRSSSLFDLYAFLSQTNASHKPCSVLCEQGKASLINSPVCRKLRAVFRIKEEVCFAAEIGIRKAANSAFWKLIMSFVGMSGKLGSVSFWWDTF